MQLPIGLEALNFAMAGAREGFGPFLGVFLQNEGFNPASTGLAMSLAGIAGVVATVPLGVLIDRIDVKLRIPIQAGHHSEMKPEVFRFDVGRHS